MSKRDQILKKEGWTKQFVTNEPRLSEMVETYRSIGFAVRLEPVLTGKEAKEDECKECRICFEGGQKEKYMVIYTRPEKNFEENHLDEMF
ncbi:MAG: hypothetical protein SV062_04925 [Thermodesulfobacteriota bacterium]|nr:hypothetical protein [Thermodesulfobacteriota bacterium]